MRSSTIRKALRKLAEAIDLEQGFDGVWRSPEENRKELAKLYRRKYGKALGIAAAVAGIPALAYCGYKKIKNRDEV